MEKKEYKLLKCQNKKCGYYWRYTGDSLFFTTCPRCHYKVSTQQRQIDISSQESYDKMDGWLAEKNKIQLVKDL